MVLSRWMVAAVGLGFVCTWMGCGSSESGTDPSVAGSAGADAGSGGAGGSIASDAGDGGAGADAAPDDAGRSPTCQSQDQALQKALDDTREPSPNALLAIRNPDCGTTVYASGSTETALATSLWRIGSLTKTFVSTAILSLVKEGAVSLDDPLSKWVPNVPNTDGVTVIMLLDHRSGIFSYTDDWTLDGTQPMTPEQLVDLATSHPPLFAPDADFSYSNTNYVLLGMILEAATGQKAGAVLHARAMGPANLESTLLDGYDTIDPNRMARGMTANGKDCTFFLDPSVPWTAGAMVSSGGDLVEWVETLYGTYAVLDAGQRALLTSKTSIIPWTGFFHGSQYGLGVMLLDPAKNANAGQGIGHAGEISGYLTHAFYFPEKKTTIVSIVNSDDGPIDEVFLAALNTLFPGGAADAGAGDAAEQ